MVVLNISGLNISGGYENNYHLIMTLHLMDIIFLSCITAFKVHDNAFNLNVCHRNYFIECILLVISKNFALESFKKY